MNKFIEGVKDFLYDSIDYIIIIGIVGAVVLVIGWRLDLLFAKDAIDMPPQVTIVQKPENKPSQPSGQVETPGEENPEDDPEIQDDLPEDATPIEPEDNNPPPTDPVTVEGRLIKITIPQGSLPSKIGSILEENGLVTSKNDFVMKSQDLKLDTKLKSGTFEIKYGTSLEDIVRIIAK